jgi:hypothetical protein
MRAQVSACAGIRTLTINHKRHSSHAVVQGMYNGLSCAVHSHRRAQEEHVRRLTNTYPDCTYSWLFSSTMLTVPAVI